ncbi:MAG: peptide/nickel transport system substrate-binding protein [Candidatus Azotimanducaceae bacterium]|jgi:peptide/nickel transport system substrate-binding protein
MKLTNLTLLLLLLFISRVGYTAEEPQYGGDLNVGTVNVTLSPLSWDPADWVWKSNHDAGVVREQLFAGDLEKSVRKGGQYPFISDAYLPSDAIRGELAETWVWQDPLTLVIKLREGVMFTETPGVMKARELVADDVVFTYNLLNDSPKRIPTYFDHILSVVAVDDHTVTFNFKEYNAEWAYRFGYGYYSSIVPREMAEVDAKDWRNVTGTGPFTLGKYVQANAQIYAKNPDYWDKELIGGTPYAIPFVDQLAYRIIKDEATYLTALRTGQIDILEAIRWIAVDHLKETTPELKWNRWLSTSGNFMSLRVDKAPFDNPKVRRALNLAVNQKEIAELFYGGHAEVMAYPQHPGFGDYYQPLDEMPESVQELFEYNPEKARQLLQEAGYGEGFDFEVQVCSCSPSNMDLIPLLDSYLSKIGVSITIKPMEYASFLSAMTTRTHAAGYLMGSGHVNPTTSLRKSFVTAQTWNPSMYSDPEFDERIRQLHLIRDESKRIDIVRELTVQILDEAPYIWLPIAYVYTAWWPWVKNYGGELRVGAVRPGPIYGRIWIDQDLKKELGF